MLLPNEDEFLKDVEWVNCIRGIHTPDAIYVEDTLAFRQLWLKSAQEHHIKLACYSNPEEFLLDFKYFTSNTKFYFDYDLGSASKNGLDLAKIVLAELNVQSALVTGNSKNMFTQGLESKLLWEVFEKRSGLENLLRMST